MASGTPALGLGVGGARETLSEGELGAVESGAELPDSFARLLARPKPDPHALTAASRARFGRETFAVGGGKGVESADGAA